MTAAPKSSFYDVITAAVADIAAHGFDSQARIEYWIDQIRRAAQASLTPPHKMAEMLQQAMRSIYKRLIDQGQISKYHPGVSKFTIDRVKPRLHAELERRIMAAANLIVLNRESAIQKTLQRFSGWSTSIPAGGSKAIEKVVAKTDIRKALAQLPFEERRVLIDQGHKFTSALNDVVALDAGALAAQWHSHWRQAGYDYREDHRERDLVIYAVRGNWALERGLMKAGKTGYTDSQTRPGEEPFCRCFFSYLYAVRDLPPEMVTLEGRKELARIRVVA